MYSTVKNWLNKKLEYWFKEKTEIRIFNVRRARVLVTYTREQDKSDSFTITGVADIKPRQTVTVEVTRPDGSTFSFDTLCRIDTDPESLIDCVPHYQHHNLSAWLAQAVPLITRFDQVWKGARHA